MQLLQEQLPETNNTKVNQKSNGQMACIMFTEIIGYHNFVERNEETALQVLDQNRQLHRSLIQLHGGKIIQDMGEAILASFNSASTAVNCALEIQQESKSISKLELRIGLHLGEVTFVEKDVFGLVVNIASRLQHLARKGQILVSETVINHMRSQEGLRTQLLGSKKLKNVSQPVKTYAVKTAVAEVHISALAWTLTGLFAIAQKALSMVL